MSNRLRRLRKAISAFAIELPLVVLSPVVPKRRGLWVFLPIFYESQPFNGNIKYLFGHVVRNHDEIDAYCLGVGERDRRRNRDLAARMCRRRYSPIGILRILRAEYLFVDGLTRLSLGSFRVVQLWHGTGFKNIATQTPGAHSFRERIRRGNAIADFVVATSEADRQRKEASFNARRVCVTGSPRNDILVSVTSDGAREIKRRLGLPGDRRIVGYAPTYRDTGDFVPFSPEAWRRLDVLAARRGFAFAVKKHPSETRLRVPDDLEYVRDVSDRVGDVQEFLAVVDLLVSDYSGIVSDFALLGRPILFFVYDFDRYVRTCRDFYYDLRSILPGPFVSSANELLAYLESDSWQNEGDYQRRLEQFSDLFQSHRDGRSCERVVSALLAAE